MASNGEIEVVDNRQVKTSSIEVSEGTIMAMEAFTSTMIGMSQQIAENNAAKYKAQAEVLIEDVKAKMQTELAEIDKYYTTRQQQEKALDDILSDYRQQLNILISDYSNEKDKEMREAKKEAIEMLKDGVGLAINKQMESIHSEQQSRTENSKPRNKGILGFFKRS